MTTCDENYYGTGWGTAPYGNPEDTSSFGISRAVAVRENVIEVVFSEPIYFSSFLDIKDASNAEKYVMNTLPSIGNNGQDARPVSVVKVEKGSDSSTILLWLDRSMTPYPARYSVQCLNIWTENKTTPIDPCFGTYGLYGSFKTLQQNLFDLVVPQRDFASPQTKDAFADPLPFSFEQYLGVFNIDDRGDYAFDEGETSFKKRILRRLVTMKNGFQHLPGYGIGIQQYAKKLSRATDRQKIATDIQLQLRREPEVAEASATFTPYPKRPDAVKLTIKIRTKTGLGYTITQGFEVGLWISQAGWTFSKQAVVT